jgi:hypothetical protein
MKIFLAIFAILAIGGLLYADWKWLRWIDARRKQRNRH